MIGKFCGIFMCLCSTFSPAQQWPWGHQPHAHCKTLGPDSAGDRAKLMCKELCVSALTYCGTKQRLHARGSSLFDLIWNSLEAAEQQTFLKEILRKITIHSLGQTLWLRHNIECPELEGKAGEKAHIHTHTTRNRYRTKYWLNIKEDNNEGNVGEKVSYKKKKKLIEQ